MLFVERCDGMSPRGRMVFSQGETFHQDTHNGMAYLFYYTKQTPMGKISMKTTMTAGRSAGAVEKSVCCFVYKVKVTDD